LYKPQITFLFIDGLGIGENDPAKNPLVVAEMPNLKSLLGTMNPDDWRDGIVRDNVSLKPLDACLGVDGLPQSATGHASIYTGVNTQKLLGRHLQGFPNGKLRALLQERGIIPVLHRAGLRVRFVNAYHTPTLEEYEKKKRPFSATSVMALEAFGEFPAVALIAERGAIYHDITGRSLRCRREDAPTLSPSDAGGIVAELACENDFTLFEYFLTDFAGHRQRMHRNVIYLERYDTFLGGVLAGSDLSKQTILIISDHGNIEDLSTRSHTYNPVPLIAIGAGHREYTDRAENITDPYHTILEKFNVLAEVAV